MNQETNDREIRLAIFASGAGTNAKKIIEHFKKHSKVQVTLIVCNKPGAGIIEVAKEKGINVLMIEKEQFFRGDGYVPELRDKGIAYVILAGFLWKIPDTLIDAFPQKIINIHPALLPKFGGKGMYGSHVHEAVIAAGEKESGVTIHFVDGHYDNGDIIMQATCNISPGETAETLAAKIHVLEHKHYPQVIEQLVSDL